MADEQVIAEAKGVGGQVELLEDRVRITRRGMVASLAQHGDTVLLLARFGVRLKKAGLSQGFIQFESGAGTPRTVQSDPTPSFSTAGTTRPSRRSGTRSKANWPPARPRLPRPVGHVATTSLADPG